MANSNDMEVITSILESTSLKVEDVLLVCMTLGKMLQCIPTKGRELAITRITNKRNDLLEQGNTTGHMMLSTVLESWKDFNNQRSPL